MRTTYFPKILTWIQNIFTRPLNPALHAPLLLMVGLIMEGLCSLVTQTFKPIVTVDLGMTVDGFTAWLWNHDPHGLMPFLLLPLGLVLFAPFPRGALRTAWTGPAWIILHGMIVGLYIYAAFSPLRHPFDCTFGCPR